MKYFSIILSVLGLVYAIYEYRKKQNKAVQGLGKVESGRPPKVRIVYSKNQKASERAKVSSSRDVYHWFKKLWSSQIQTREEMLVLLLNRNNQVLGYHTLSSGGITGTVADIRLLYAVALKSLATSVIIAHNHPSGNLQPSQSDIQLTRKVKEAGQVMDIKLLDHLIITKDGYYSFADEGDM
jgi:DNA repair protein RadC